MKESRRGRKKPPLRNERYLVTCGLCKARFASITWTHLVHRHHLPRRKTFGFYRPYHAAHFFLAGEVRKKQARAKRRWSRRRIIAGIRELGRLGRPLNLGAVARSDQCLADAALRIFGSWGIALGAAGIHVADVRLHESWSPELVVRRIQELEAAAKPLNSGAVQRSEDARLTAAAFAHFGSWDRALRAAGLDPEEIRKNDPPWTREGILEAIRRRHEAGLSIRSSTVLREHGGLYNAGRREFGTWSRAVEAAGIQYPWERAPWKWSDDKIISEIRSRGARGLSLASQRVQREQRDLYSAARRRFGSWTKARAQAGISDAGRPGSSTRRS